MIKSSQLSITNSNTHKINDVAIFIDEYHKLCQHIIDNIWHLDKIPRLLGKELLKDTNTWLSQRAIQCCAKQASGIVRGTRKKQKQRFYKYNELVNEGKFKQARRLKKIIDATNVTKPNIKTIQPELDSRFIKMDFDNKTSFDGWISLTSLGNKMKVELPIKKTKHFNWLTSRGKMKDGIRLSSNKITFMFDIPDVSQKDNGSIVGLDIGVKNVYSMSDNQQSGQNPHGWDLEKIQQRLSRRKKGSKGFKRAQELRKNYVNWSINNMNLSGIKTLKLENIKYLRKGCKSSRYMSHWTYAAIYDKLDDYCSEHGVHVEKVSPTYTSQRCSQCGWTRKSNRKGKLFKCKACSFECDADLNASRNIVLELPVIGKQQRLLQSNRSGFYYNVISQGCIVPDVKRG